MTVEVLSTSHHVEADEPDSDGTVAWCYEYDLMTLRAPSGLEVIARTYSGTPHHVTLLRFTMNGEAIGQGDVKRLYLDSVATIADFLRARSFTSVQWFGGDTYVEVPD
jgi:hypothetical protein